MSSTLLGDGTVGGVSLEKVGCANLAGVEGGGAAAEADGGGLVGRHCPNRSLGMTLATPAASAATEMAGASTGADVRGGSTGRSEARAEAGESSAADGVAGENGGLAPDGVPPLEVPKG